jgi:hypothetical protein
MQNGASLTLLSATICRERGVFFPAIFAMVAAHAQSHPRSRQLEK